MASIREGAMVRVDPGQLPAGARVLSILLWTYPLVWLTGMDGFLWIVLLPLLMISFLDARGRVLYLPPPVALGLGLFTVGFLVSGFGVQSAARYLTWGRDGLVVIWTLLVAATVRSLPREHAEKYVLLPAAVTLGFACLAGLLSALLQEPLELRTLAYYLLPGGLRGTEFAQQQTVKVLYSDGWFAGFAYPRIRSFFMYGNNLAQASAGFLILFAADRLWRARRIYIAVALLAVAIIPFTTSRSAFLGLVAGLGVLVLMRSGTVARFLVGVAFLAAAIWLAANWPWVSAMIDAFTSLRGGGSRSARLEIYRLTFESIVNNPLGHGTQRDVMTLKYPLGSHSSILGILYKFGILAGAGLFLAISGLLLQYPQSELRLRISTIALACGYFVFAVFEELYLDVTTATMLAVYLGYLATAPCSADSDSVRLSDRVSFRPQLEPDG
jgi:hypothetical protein